MLSSRSDSNPGSSKKLPAFKLPTWVLFVLVLLGLSFVLIGARGLQTKHAGKPGVVASATPMMDLGPGDLWTASVHELTRSVAISGEVKAVDTALIKAKVSAQLKTLLVREGDTVKAGQLIGQLDATELQLKLRQAEQTAAAARAQRDIAQRALQNNRALVEQGFISATGLETSASNAASAQANFEAALAAVGLARQGLEDARLIAPISGVVAQRFVQPGERVSVEARLLEVVDLSKLEVQASVPAQEASLIQVGQAAQIQIDGWPQALEAQVTRINPSTQTGTRAVLLYLSLAPHPGLRQGLFAQGQIQIQQQRMLLLPVSAVRIDQSRPYVLMVENQTIVKYPVVLGERGQAFVQGALENVVEIKEGLSPGAPVLREHVGNMPEGTPVRLGAKL